MVTTFFWGEKLRVFGFFSLGGASFFPSNTLDETLHCHRVLKIGLILYRVFVLLTNMPNKTSGIKWIEQFDLFVRKWNEENMWI